MQRPTAIRLSLVQETEIRPSENNVGVREAAKEVVESGTTAAHAAADDLKRQATTLAIGVGLALGAALLAVFAVGFVLATIAVALSTFLPWWASMLIVTAFVIGATALVALLARRFIKKGSSGPLLRNGERERLVQAFAHFRHELGNTAKARARIPVATAAAGFVLGGGLRAAARLAFRRRR
jgi:Putative Actinobacterial Holin-X, holin superfamily III